MATGDKAAAAGLAVFPAIGDVRMGYDNDNVRGDELAEHMTTGTHPWGNITGKPPTFTPSAHTHQANTLPSSGLGFATNVDAAIGWLNANKAGAGDVAAAVNTANAAAAAVAGKRDVGDGQFGGTPIYTPHGRQNGVTSSYVAAYINGDGRIGASPSSRRFKENITDAHVDTAAVLSIRVREFDRIGGGHEVGLIAEEVDEHVPAIVVRSGERIDGVHYHLLPVVLLSVVQEQAQQIADLTTRLAELEAR